MSDQDQDQDQETEQDTDQPSACPDFDFDDGDRVLVRHREHGTSGNIVAKFEAEVVGFSNVDNDLLTAKVRLKMPWGDWVSLAPYQAEFEVLDDE